MRIAVVANSSWYLYNFRLSLMKSLEEEGHQVFAIAPIDEYSEKLEGRFLEWDVGRFSTHLAKEFQAIRQLYKVLKRSQIELVLGYTHKANLYSLVCGQVATIRIINNISGLGVLFVKKNLLSWGVRQIYLRLLKASDMIFFQNASDQEILLKNKDLKNYKTGLLPGSGVDIQKYSPKIKKEDNRIDFILIARLLKEKGIYDFVEAAKIVKQTHPDTTFSLLGFLEPHSSSGVTEQEISKWAEQGIIEYLGPQEDVRPFIAIANCIVLPSYYREGIPRILLEAASMAKPIITTDHPGCRNTMDDGITGLLCAIKNPIDLADKMLYFLQLPQEKQNKMGEAGRKKMLLEFNETIVIKAYLKVIQQLSSPF